MATIPTKVDYSRTLPDGIFTAIGSSVPPLDDRLLRLEAHADAVETAVGTDDVVDAASIQARVAQVITDCATVTSGLSNHLADATAAHAASAISFAPVGTIAATDVQAAIAEMLAEAAGTGAPTGADYLTGTAQGGLSAEIVVGTTPQGELGGTWASPTVDAVHSGSSHAANLATAEVYTDSAITALSLGNASTKTTGTSAGNVPILDGGGKLASAVLPTAGAVAVTVHYANQTARLAGGAAQYTMSFQDDTKIFWFLSGTDPTNAGHWQSISSGGVTSVDGQTGPAVSLAAVYAALVHTHTPTQVGLSAVTNIAQMPASYLDTDVTLAGNSDIKVASQKATLAKITSALAAAGSAVQADGTVWLDTFAGATDDLKLTAAMSYAAAQTYAPIIKFGRTGNKYVFATGGRIPYDGMRFQGPGQGEYNRSNFSPLQVQLNHPGSWFVAQSGNTSCVSMENMSFYGTNSNYFLSGLSGNHNWQQIKLHNVCLNGFNMWLGGPPGTSGTDNAFLTTASQIFTGQSNLGGLYGKYGIWAGGSDSKFFGDGALIDTPNSVGNGGANSGRYMFYANFLSRSLISRVYITAENYGGIRVDGSAISSTIGTGHEFGHGLIISHVELQGRDEGIARDGLAGAQDGALYFQSGGGVVLDHCNLSWGMASVATSVDTTARGYAMITGGRVLFDGCGWAKTLAPNNADLTATTGVPMIWNAGGWVRAVNAMPIGPWSFNPQVHTASGTTVVDNSYTVV